MRPLIRFINDRLAEWKRAAEAVKPLGYTTDMGGTRLDEDFSHSRRKFYSEDGRSYLEGDQAASDHFRLHNPAMVLHEVAALLRLVDDHELSDDDAVAPLYHGGPSYRFGCKLCHDWDGVTVGEGYCDTLLALASFWEDHPDYQAALRV